MIEQMPHKMPLENLLAPLQQVKATKSVPWQNACQQLWPLLLLGQQSWPFMLSHPMQRMSRGVSHWFLVLASSSQQLVCYVLPHERACKSAEQWFFTLDLVHQPAHQHLATSLGANLRLERGELVNKWSSAIKASMRAKGHRQKASHGSKIFPSKQARANGEKECAFETSSSRGGVH
eukprot:3219271-Amphidinium_carterae.1